MSCSNTIPKVPCSDTELLAINDEMRPYSHFESHDASVCCAR